MTPPPQIPDWVKTIVRRIDAKGTQEKTEHEKAIVCLMDIMTDQVFWAVLGKVSTEARCVCGHPISDHNEFAGGCSHKIGPHFCDCQRFRKAAVVKVIHT
jgi:hypothetical protein